MAYKLYSEKLNDPHWQKKRLEIFERDDWKCQACKDSETTLHVHHIVYQNNKEPWDIDNEFLITYCEDCHSVVGFLNKTLDLNIDYIEIHKFNDDLSNNKLLTVLMLGVTFIVILSEKNDIVFFKQLKSNELDTITNLFKNNQIKYKEFYG